MRNLGTFGATILCGISLLLAGWGLYTFFTAAKERRHDNARAWHTVICYLEAQIVASPRVSVEQRVEALKVYDHILVLVDAHPCPKGAA
jgi:hypothetical protein